MNGYVHWNRERFWTHANEVTTQYERLLEGIQDPCQRIRTGSRDQKLGFSFCTVFVGGTFTILK